MILLQSAVVSILFILSISAFPLTDVAEHRLIDKINNKTTLSNLFSPLNDNISEQLFEVTTRSTGPTWYTKSSTYAPTSGGSSWWIYLLAGLGFLCCAGCGGTRVKTGKWIWVSD